jgi:hypothetical protein
MEIIKYHVHRNAVTDKSSNARVAGDDITRRIVDHERERTRKRRHNTSVGHTITDTNVPCVSSVPASILSSPGFIVRIARISS